ncbi:MAG: hypothetical protein R2864_08425 [Syntrophotaleaceae bacterium]
MNYRFIAALAAMAMLGGGVGWRRPPLTAFIASARSLSPPGDRVEAIGTTHKVTAEEIEKRGACSKF